MGFFGYWLVIRGGTEEGLRKLGLTPAGEGLAPGWMFALGQREPPEDLNGLVADASMEGGAAVGAYVYDSDFGLVVGGKDGQSVADVVINADAARTFGLEADSDIDAFARWTEAPPHHLSPAEVGAVLNQQWVLAEEGVVELLELAGLPAP